MRWPRRRPQRTSSHAELLDCYSTDVDDLATWKPDSEDFAINIRAVFGSNERGGGDEFLITLCTPGWLAQRADDDGIALGQHKLIVNYYSYPRLEAFLQKRARNTWGESWHEIATKLGRLGHWEFEDYDG